MVHSCCRAAGSSKASRLSVGKEVAGRAQVDLPGQLEVHPQSRGGLRAGHRPQADGDRGVGAVRDRERGMREPHLLGIGPVPHPGQDPRKGGPPEAELVVAIALGGPRVGGDGQVDAVARPAPGACSPGQPGTRETSRGAASRAQVAARTVAASSTR